MSTILANKLDRKSLKRPDEFLAAGRKLMEKLGDQSKMMVIGGGVLLIVALAAGFLMSRGSEKEMAAQNALFSAKKKLVAGDASALESVVSNYSGSRAAFDAALALGDRAFDKQDFAAAVTWFEKSVSMAPRAFEKALAAYSLAYAYEGAKDYAKASDQFNKALNQGQPALKAELLLSLARVQTLAGKKDDARKTYDRLISEHAKTEESERAEALRSNL